ncbi:MAG: hypothetical protein HY305_01875 [Sphingobacteriales bacterium]|nr:hypothetical protein [Sphingobacteriales bacterium]
MKFITSVILTALLSFAACIYLPWWSIAIIAFAVAALIPQTPVKSFVAGFVALFILWGILAFLISFYNGHILAHKVSVIILKKDDPAALILITAVLGGWVAGLAALAGCFLRKAKS